MKEGSRVRVTNLKHPLHGAMGRVTKIRKMGNETMVTIEFANFEIGINEKSLEVVRP